ncbi:hypothetical protein B0H14DRAFT_3431152 [Mycena olivaceomarginata]|nr:hypothetical protein B0H14DRAFT_3431152 [Mycena olivaceomarginata]
MTSGLDICVVGAGLGGLAAAIAMRQQGHRVQIFETSLSNSEIGAAITLTKNALRVLDHLGWNEDNCKVSNHNVQIIRLSADVAPSTTSIFRGSEVRVDLHEELKRIAIGEVGLQPVPVVNGSTDGNGRVGTRPFGTWSLPLPGRVRDGSAPLTGTRTRPVRRVRRVLLGIFRRS